MTYDKALTQYQQHEVFGFIALGMLRDAEAPSEAIYAYSDEVCRRMIVDAQNIVEAFDDDTGLLMVLHARGC